MPAMTPRQAEELFRTGVRRSVFKAERHIPVPGSQFGEEASVHVYPLRDKPGYLWAIRRTDYDRNVDIDIRRAILRAGIFPHPWLIDAARHAVTQLYKRLPPKRRA